MTGDHYRVDKKGQYWYLFRNGNIVMYKSKNELKVRSRYEGLLKAQDNLERRRNSARYFLWKKIITIACVKPIVYIKAS